MPNEFHKVPLQDLTMETLPLLSFDQEETLIENLKRFYGKKSLSKLRAFVVLQDKILLDNPTLSTLPQRELDKGFNVLYDLLLVLEEVI